MKYTLVLFFVAGAIYLCNARPEPQPGDGGITYGVDQENGGVRPNVNVEHTIFKDDHTEAKIRGHWERTYHGQNHGQRNYGGGFSVQHKWG